MTYSFFLSKYFTKKRLFLVFLKITFTIIAVPLFVNLLLAQSFQPQLMSH
nr:MAG TPA: hypothetical protein [Bacteriophage sp.]